VSQTLLLAAVLAVTTLVAELAGAANLGIALGIGQIAFAIALVALMLTRWATSIAGRSCPRHPQPQAARARATAAAGVSRQGSP
jgi:hypothetical protein